MASHDVHLHVDQTSMMHSWLGRERVRLSRSPWFPCLLFVCKRPSKILTERQDSGYTRLTSEVPTLTRTRHPKYAILQAPHPSPSPLPPPSYPPVKQVHSLIESITTHRIAHTNHHLPNHHPQHATHTERQARCSSSNPTIQESSSCNIENRIPEDTFISQ